MNHKPSTIYQFATIISHIFEPMVVLTLIGILGGVYAELSRANFGEYILVVLLFMVAPVIVFRIWYMKTKGADWDLADRKKRIVPVFSQVIAALLDIGIVAFLFHNSRLTEIFVVLF